MFQREEEGTCRMHETPSERGTLISIRAVASEYAGPLIFERILLILKES